MVSVVRDIGEGLDLFDPDFIANPYPIFAALHKQDPVCYHPSSGLWLVSRHADVRAVLADPDNFLPNNALTAFTAIPPAGLRQLAQAGFALPPTLANNNTDSHAGLRRLVASFLTPAAVRATRPRVRQLLHECLDRLPEHGSCDLAAEVTDEIPARVLMELLGIANIEVAQLKTWSRAGLELFWGQPDCAQQQNLIQLATEFYHWLAEQFRAAKPESADIFGRLVAHRVSGQRPLRLAEAVGLCFFLLIAGQETTTQLLNVAIQQLAARPELWQRLATGEPGLAEDCVEEILRQNPPVHTWRRITARTVLLSNVELPAGAQLLLLLAGSGMDPTVFAQPQKFCPGRIGARQHLAFGYGRHFCLGAGLARAEAAIIVSELAQRLPGLRLVEHNPPMLTLLSFRAPTRLQVSLT